MNSSNQNQSENRYNVRNDIWQSYDNDQRQMFNQIYKTEQQRREEVLNDIPADCRDTVSQHFDQILTSVIQNVIRHTDLQLA